VLTVLGLNWKPHIQHSPTWIIPPEQKLSVFEEKTLLFTERNCMCFSYNCHIVGIKWVREMEMNAQYFSCSFFSDQYNLFLRTIFIFSLFIYSYVHTLIGSFPRPAPFLPRFQAEPILPFSPILLKRRHKQ
jgi:hypothetical protein